MKKRIISLCMTVVLLLALMPQIVLYADATEVIAEGTCGDNLTWTLDDKGTLTIQGIGEMTNFGIMPEDGPAWYEFRKQIISIVIESGVTSIGDYAFYCPNLSTVSIPGTVISIGESAFMSCASLSSIYIPESVEKIGEECFLDCRNLSKFTVNENNSNYCSDSQGVLFSKDMTVLIQAPALLDGEYRIPNGVKQISIWAFRTGYITHLYIPESVETIDKYAFSFSQLDAFEVDPNNKQYASDLQGVLYSKDLSVLINVPNNVDESFSIPETVEIIADSAFSDCNKLTQVIIPSTVKEIGSVPFLRCNLLTDVKFLGDKPTFSGVFRMPNTDHIEHLYYSNTNITWNDFFDNGENDWYSIDMPNYNGFWLSKEGWPFANAAQSFAEEPVSHADDYFIPRERYDALYGKAYVDAQDDLFTTEWGGNCAGMSATAILFFLDKLDWESIDAEYTEDFANPNDFYRTVNLHNQSQSYYPAIGNDTEVTRLIEAYQLYINAIDKSRLVENLDNTYFTSDVTEKKTLFGSEYIINHVPNGTYIASMLEEFQTAYEDNNPLFIVLQADGFGHGIVARTDLKPEDMGDGWWRVYVYDPNKPYINESVISTVSGVEVEPKYTFGCNTLLDNGGDIYLELNPSLNQWRYCTSVNSNSSDSYIGSSPSGELLWKNYYHDTTPENQNNDEGKKNNAKMPDFFYTIDLTDLAMADFANPHFDSTRAWIPENDLAVAVDGDTDCSIYASTGELVAIVEDGDAFVLTDSGSYDAYIGQTEDGGSTGGRIYLPNDVYIVYYTSGTIQFLGNDNALSFSSEGAAELTVDTALNSLQVLAQEDGIAAVKCANVTSTDECSYVDTEGALVAGETFTIAYSDENKVEASTDSKDGEFQLYQKDADQEEASATKVIKSSSLLWLWFVGGVIVIVGFALFVFKRKKT